MRARVSRVIQLERIVNRAFGWKTSEPGSVVPRSGVDGAFNIADRFVPLDVTWTMMLADRQNRGRAISVRDVRSRWRVYTNFVRAESKPGQPPLAADRSKWNSTGHSASSLRCVSSFAIPPSLRPLSPPDNPVLLRRQPLAHPFYLSLPERTVAAAIKRQRQAPPDDEVPPMHNAPRVQSHRNEYAGQRLWRSAYYLDLFVFPRIPFRGYFLQFDFWLSSRSNASCPRTRVKRWRKNVERSFDDFIKYVYQIEDSEAP